LAFFSSFLIHSLDEDFLGKSCHGVSQKVSGREGQIPRHAISRDKGQEENQQHQSEWKGLKKPPGAGSGNEAVDRHMAILAIPGRELVWHPQGPRQEKQETEEAEGL
jgi:hypothetical protein